MALIADISFSKKIPVAGEQFSSQGYSLTLRTEIAEIDPAAIQARLHETFELVKNQVEHELANGNGKSRRPGPADPGSNTVDLPPPNPRVKASTKQIKYLVDMLGRRDIGISTFNADIKHRFGVDGIYELTKAQASKCIDELSEKRKAA